MILATAPNSKAIASLINALGANGQLLVIAATAEPMEISPVQLIGRCKEIKGWSSGHAKDSEDTLNFSALSNIRPMVETFPLSRVNEAYQTMMENKARFRTVLTMDE